MTLVTPYEITFIALVYTIGYFLFKPLKKGKQ